MGVIEKIIRQEIKKALIFKGSKVNNDTVYGCH